MFNIKYDEIRKVLKANNREGDTSIKYRLRANNGSSDTYYAMWTTSGESYELGSSGNTDSYTVKWKNTNNTANSNMKSYPGVEYDVYNNCKSTNSSNNNTHPFNLTLRTKKGGSVTWHLDASGSEKKLEIYKNPRMDYTNDSYNRLQEENLYLIGNLRNVDPTNNNWQADKSCPMIKTIYPLNWNDDGNNDISRIDSIVYSQTILRPKEGFGNLYIGVAPESAFDEGLDGIGGSRFAGWDHVIRPEVQYKQDKNSTDAYEADAVGLSGGIFTFGDEENSGQALNPGGADQYESYTFSINLTTATYRMMMNKELFIIGPAVSTTATSDDNGKGDSDTSDYNSEDYGWYNSGDSNDSKHALKLKLDSRNQCYVYSTEDDADGNPIAAKLHFTNGKGFRFATNKRFDLTNYGEDKYVPCDLSQKTYAYQKVGDGNFPETQYVNRLTTYVTASEKHYDMWDDEKQRDIVFNLPTGDYTIRLYNKVRANEFDETETYEIYYTLDRVFGFSSAATLAKTYTGSADYDETTLGYPYFRAFSDWHAYDIPEGVHVFIIGSSDDSQQTVELQEITSLGYIPAQTGVLMTSADASTSPTFLHHDNPNLRLPDSYTTNLLQPAIYDQAVPAQLTEGGTTRYNYVISCKKLNASKPKAEVAYFKSNGGNSGRNNSFLQLTGTAASTAKAFSFAFDDMTITAINNAEEAATVLDGSMYNLAGQRVGSSYKGIVIQNGRKRINR